jgi:hypothetical protein
MTFNDGIPKLGEYVDGQLVASTGPGRWQVTLTKNPDGWQASLISRELRLYDLGDVDMFWVFRLDPAARTILLSDSNFGRYSITDGMRAKYVRGLRALQSILSDPPNLTTIQPDDLSEVKGMLNRCVRQDQWDWLTVYRILGLPTFHLLRLTVALLGEIARALRRGDAKQAHALIGQLSGSELVLLVENALSRIEVGAPKLRDALGIASIDTASNFVTDEDEDEVSSETIISEVQRAKIDRANRTHNETLNILVALLKASGFIVERSKLIDAYSRLMSGPAIFEVKSITPENERSQCRHALSQLKEYRFLHGVSEASLWLVLSQEPSIPWMIPYLLNEGIHMLWLENGRFEGPSIANLTESAKSARLRQTKMPR